MKTIEQINFEDAMEAIQNCEPMHITECENYETCDYCNPSIEPDFDDDDDDEVIAKPKPKNYIYNDGGKSLTGRKGNSGDCVVRAMAIALDLDYDYCYKVLAQANKDAGYTKSARDGLQRTTYEKVFNKHGWFWTSAPKNLWVWDEDNYMYLNRKARHKDMPKNKRVIARMSKHIAAIVDQEIHDIFDSSYKMVYGYWEKK